MSLAPPPCDLTNDRKPGVAILHTIYGTYHLCRRASSRTPASSASYMLFASFFDASLIPFYAFSAWVASSQPAGWTTVLPAKTILPTLIVTVFYLNTVAASIHTVTLAVSIYLTVTFRKITKLPPDMNPLEDNLTSRHKRNKSSISTVTTLNMSEKRLSDPLESKRSSGLPYEDLSRPPTIPFFHTRTQSTDSFSTYKDTPPPSRDSRSELPSRQYGVQPGNIARNSAVDLKRSSYYNGSTPPKKQQQKGQYSEVSLNDSPTNHNIQDSPLQRSSWYANDSFSGRTKGSTTSSPMKSKRNTYTQGYTPVSQPYDNDEDDRDLGTSPTKKSNADTYIHPNPVGAHPPTPNKQRHGFPLQRNPNSPQNQHQDDHRHPVQRARPQSTMNLSTNSPLGEISINRRTSGTMTTDIADISTVSLQQTRDSAGTPVSFRAKHYGDLKPGTPPIMIGNGNTGGRQVSSGNDYLDVRSAILGKGEKSGGKKGGRYRRDRDVSGKIAEEGRGDGGVSTEGEFATTSWGTRLRKISAVDLQIL